MKDASEIYKDFKYLNLKGLDLSKYEKMDSEKGWDALEKELLKRIKPGVKITDDVVDEIDSILLDVFHKKLRAEPSKPWDEVNKKIEKLMSEN
jgi:hypothetical protein